jgi:hypothetical protein
VVDRHFRFWTNLGHLQLFLISGLSPGDRTVLLPEFVMSPTDTSLDSAPRMTQRAVATDGPSWIDLTEIRVTRTESRFAAYSTDFCNKIGTKQDVPLASANVRCWKTAGMFWKFRHFRF